jgi:hypothetical protein
MFHQCRAGFTLSDVAAQVGKSKQAGMVVVLGLLVSFALLEMGLKAREREQLARARAQMTALAKALDRFYLDHGYYP